MRQIPLQAIPNQIVTTMIDGKRHDIELVSRNGGLYVTLAIDGEIELMNRAVRSYAPITDNLVMVNTDGLHEEPGYQGLGEKFLLLVVD